MFKYTIDDLASKCNVTKQSIYAQIKKNKGFYEQESRFIRKKKMYTQAAMDKLMEYYQGSVNKSGDEVLQVKPDDDEKNARMVALEEENKFLRSRVEELEKRLAVSEQERGELIKQNGMVLLALTEERTERQKLLMAPKKKSIFSIFKRDKVD